MKYVVSGHDLLRLDSHMEPLFSYQGGDDDDFGRRKPGWMGAIAALGDDEVAVERMREALTAWSWCQG